MIARYAVFYNFTETHKTLRTTPAQAAGLTERVWDMADIVRLLEELLEEVGMPVLVAQANETLPGGCFACPNTQASTKIRVCAS